MSQSEKQRGHSRPPGTGHFERHFPLLISITDPLSKSVSSAANKVSLLRDKAPAGLPEVDNQVPFCSDGPVLSCVLGTCRQRLLTWPSAAASTGLRAGKLNGQSLRLRLLQQPQLTMRFCGDNSSWALLTGPGVAWHGVGSVLLLKEFISSQRRRDHHPQAASPGEPEAVALVLVKTKGGSGALPSP